MPFICLLLFSLLALFPTEQAVSATLALGLDNHGKGYLEVVDPIDFKHRAWPKVDWIQYGADKRVKPVPHGAMSMGMVSMSW